MASRAAFPTEVAIDDRRDPVGTPNGHLDLAFLCAQVVAAGQEVNSARARGNLPIRQSMVLSGS